MNTLKYSLEYHCYPIWNYTEDGELVDNDLPAELRDDTELNSMLLKIQKIFDSLFTDTSQEFSSNITKIPFLSSRQNKFFHAG